jgi:selenocysteine lyase/cysteine desulfurase
LNVVRISLSAAHTDEDVSRMLEALEAVALTGTPLAAPSVR